jgi:lauroyl/myristoyl acyltransferase
MAEQQSVPADRAVHVPLALRAERALARAMFIACLATVRRIRFENIRRLGRLLGGLQFHVAFLERRRIERDVASLLGRPAGDPFVRHLLLEAYRHSDAAVLEVLKLLDARQDLATLLADVEIGGVERVSAALAEGRGAIVLATHAGNGALFAVKLAAAGLPITLAYRESRMFERGLFERGFAQYGVEAVRATEGLQSYGHMLKALRRNRVLYVMADQGTKKAREGKVFRFLGKDMPMPAGPAQLARHARAPILPVATLGATPGWRFQVLPPVERAEGSTVHEDAAALFRIMEQQILRHPDCWSWHHRRWRRFALATHEPVRLDPATLD